MHITEEQYRRQARDLLRTIGAPHQYYKVSAISGLANMLAQIDRLTEENEQLKYQLRETSETEQRQ